MTKKSVLIVNQMHESIVPDLESIGVEAHYHPLITREEILKIIHRYDGIIVRSKLHLDAEFFDFAQKLQFVARAGAGLDQIDTESAAKKNISIFNAPEGNKDALGEHAAGLLLGLLCKIPNSNSEVKSGIWRREGNRGIELMDKTVGIIGLGNMGLAFADKLRGFNCNLIGYDIRNDLNLPDFVTQTDWQFFTENCDIVSLHVPLTEETQMMVDDSWYKQFRKNIWIINTSRGRVLKLSDLDKNLESGKVLGAALDVLENENPESYSEEEKKIFRSIADRNNTILTPHVGGWSVESYRRINSVLVSKIEDFLLQNG
jgi:D-3-phosphoglycerate dehydrogenase